MYIMLKTRAIELLGGTVSEAAKQVGVTYQAVVKWPDVLPPRIADRVLAALARKHLSKSLLKSVDEAPAPPATEPAERAA